MDISLNLNPSKRAASIKARSDSAQAEKKPSNPRADRLALSKQAIAFLEENNRRIQEQMRQAAQKKKDIGLIPTGDDSADNALKSLDKSMKILKKCSQIAASIMKGKKVPPEDLRYLMEHDIKGYQLAMAMRKPAKDNKEEKSVLDDEDRKGESSSDGASGTGSVSDAGAPAETAAPEAGEAAGSEAEA